MPSPATPDSAALAAAPTPTPPVAPPAPPPVQDPAASTGNPAQDAITNLTHAASVAPALKSAPAAALDVATAGGDITSSAQAVSVQGSRHVAAQVGATASQAHAPSGGGGIFGALENLGHRVAHDVAQGYEDPVKILELPLDALNVGMKESQHQFRYLYDVYQRHGLMAALGETFVMMAAGAAGVAVTAAGVLGTPFTGGASDVAAGAADAALAGAVVGGEDLAAGAATGAVEDVATGAAETGLKAGAKGLLKKGFAIQNKLASPLRFTAPAQAAGYAESHALFTDSWNRTSNPQYKNKAGMLVNPGNVLDGLLGIKGPAGSAVSGVSNGIFDLFTDPVNSALVDWGATRDAVSGAKAVFGKVYDRSMNTDAMKNAYDAAVAGTGTRQDASMLREVDWMAGHGYADILQRRPQFAPIIDTRMAAGEDAQADEDLVYRYDNSGKPLDPTHPQGAYYTPDGAPSSYAAHGGIRSDAFISRANQLAVTRSADGKAWNAGTGAIRSIAGPKELDRLVALQQRDPRLVADEIKERFGIDVPPRTGSELDIYGAELARKAGYKSIRFAETTPGYNDEITALHPDALRHPGSLVRVPGLADASTREEVMHVLLRENANKEALGTTAPSMSVMGAKMQALRERAAAAPKDTLHPILGGIRHPSTFVGNVGLLTSRAVGERHAVVNLASGDLNLLRRQYTMAGMSPDLIEKLIDGIRTADMGGKQLIYRNGQFMSLLAHAGILKDPADLKDMNWFNDTKEELLAKLAKKPKFQKFVLEQLNNITKMAENTDPDAMGAFEATQDGTTPSPYIDGERRFAGAVLRNQTGNVPIMDWSELHHAAQKVAGRMTFTGQMDDFLMTHVTDPIFKRWVLASGGKAPPRGASELALNYARLGFGQTMKAAWLTSLARMAGRVDRATNSDEELMSVTKAALALLTHADPVAGTTKSFNRMRDLLTAVSIHGATRFNKVDDAELAKMSDWIQVTGGQYAGPHMLPHGSTIDNLSDVGATNGGIRGMLEQARMIRGDRYTYYGPEHAEHLPAWAQHLGVTSQDPHSVQAAKAMEKVYAAGGTSDDAYEAGRAAALKSIQNMDPVLRSNYMADTLKRDGDPESMTAHESWAHHIASNVMASTHSPDRMPLTGTQGGLLHNIATASPTFPKDIRQIPIEDRPKAIPGRELIQGPGAGVMAHLSTGIYSSFLNPTIKFLSRQPIAYAEFSRQYDQGLKDVQAGLLTHDEMVIKAATNADNEALRYVHNIQDRTVLDQMMRNWIPFFFAQEQAYRRMGRLLASDPGAFRKYELMLQSAHNIVSKQQDSSGNQYFALPGAGFLDHLTTGALGMIGVPMANLNPTGFGGTLSAASVVFPAANGVRPDFSPVVTISAQATRNIFEEFGMKYADFKPISNIVNGTLTESVGDQNMNQSILQQIIPNTTAYRLVESATGNDVSFNSAMMMTMQSLAYSQNVAMEKWVKGGRQGPMPDIIPPADAQPGQLQAFLAKVKSQTRVVFLMRTILGAVSPVSADVTVNDFGLNAKLQADITKTGSVTAGFQKFLLDDPNASPYAVAMSQTATGKSLPDTQGALNWITSNSKLLNQYEYGGLWLMPQLTDNKYSSSAYYEEIASGLRQRLAPSAYLNSLYAANGDQIYYAALKQHEAIIQAAGKGTQAVSEEYTRWDAYMQQLQKQQPIWWSQFNSGQRQSNAEQSINQLGEIFSKGLAPQTQQSADVEALYQAFQQAQSQYVQAGSASNYSSAQKQIKDAWIIYVDQLATQEPQLDSIISSVFRNALTTMNTP